MKKILTISISMLLALGLLTGCGCNKKEETKIEESYNTNEGVVGDKIVEELKLTNASLVSKGNYSTLVVLVTNPTSEDKEVKKLDIYVKDKAGKEIVKLQGYVGGVVPAGESREVTSNVVMNLENAYTIEYQIVK